MNLFFEKFKNVIYQISSNLFNNYDLRIFRSARTILYLNIINIFKHYLSESVKI